MYFFIDFHNIILDHMTCNFFSFSQLITTQTTILGVRDWESFTWNDI